MTDNIRTAEASVPVIGRFALSRAELIADGVVHVVGIVLAIAAGSALLSVAAFHAAFGEYIAAVFFVVALLTSLSVSLAYNLWPVSPAKWVLRRFDHAGIFLLIAATYTPFLAQLPDRVTAAWMAGVVWVAAVVGIWVKLFLPGRFDRLALVFYLALGWSGIVVARPLGAALPPATLWLLLAGGVVYSCGVMFYARHGLRFQSAVWHGFVIAGAGLHVAAMIDLLVVARL